MDCMSWRMQKLVILFDIRMETAYLARRSPSAPSKSSSHLDVASSARFIPPFTDHATSPVHSLLPAWFNYSMKASAISSPNNVSRDGIA